MARKRAVKKVVKKKPAPKKGTPVRVTNTVKTKSMPIDDKKWERENDARTLAEAAAIKADKARLRGAKIAAKPMIKKKSSELKGLKSVVGGRK